MAIIADILTQVDAAATAVGATAFDAVAAEIVPVFRVGSVLVVALIGINLMAQAVPMTLRNGLGLNPDSDLARIRIADSAAWLIRDHLTELHPLIWAHAADGFDNNARVTSASRFAARGRADALRVVADQFREDIDRGLRVTFTADGPRLGPA